MVPGKSPPPSGWYTEDCEECCHPITDKIINYIELKVVSFTSPQYSSRLQENCSNPSGIVDEAVLNGDAIVNIVNPKDHAAQYLRNARVQEKSDGTKVYKLKYNTSFSIPQENLDYLEVVTYADIDSDRMKSDFDFDMSPSLIRNMKSLFNFKISSEKVIENGASIDTSSVFKDPVDGSYWDGPVHYHPSKGYMAGASHTVLSHASLVEEMVPNIKVQDHTMKDQILDLDFGHLLSNEQVKESNASLITSNSSDLASAYISEPHESRSPDGKTRFLFYIDMGNLVKSQSQYPGIRDDAVYESALIKNIQIYRQKATENKDKTKLGTSKVSNDKLENQTVEKVLVASSSDTSASADATPTTSESSPPTSKGRLIKSSRKVDQNFDGVRETLVGSIEEISVANLVEQRVFSVIDDEIGNIKSGKYRYTVEIQMKDPSIVHLNNKLMEVCTAKDNLDDLISRVSGTRSYDSLNNRFTDNYRKKEARKHKTIVRNAILQIMDTIELLTGQKSKAIINYLLSLSSIQSGDLKGLEIMTEILESIERKMLSILDGNLDIANYYGAKSDSKTATAKKTKSSFGMMSYEKGFDLLIDRNRNDNVGYDYVMAKPGSFPRVTAEAFESRQSEERNKFYSRQSGGNTTNDAPDARNALYNVPSSTDKDFSYITPATIQAGDISMKLIGEDTEINNVEKYGQLKLRLLQAERFGGGIYTEKADASDISKDLLSDLGLRVFYDEYRQDTSQNYTDDTTKIFGENSFNKRNIEKEDSTYAESAGEQESFTLESVRKIATHVSDKAMEAGTLNEKSIINNIQKNDRSSQRSGKTAPSLSIESFDLDREDNILTTMSKEEIENIPLGVKSLFSGRTNGAKNWLDHDRDLLRDSELKDIYRFNQGRTAVIEYFSGLGTTKTGPSTKLEEYELLTPAVLEKIPSDTPLLVRIRPVVEPKLSIGVDEGDNTEIYNKNFLITPPNSTTISPTKIVNRKEQLTNYIDTEMDRLKFSDPAQTTTNTTKNCRDSSSTISASPLLGTGITYT
tara:strand:+ start:3920 stop:7003 length:3084 start_codon:yes stop_codon:yes gene_type:complete